MFEVYKDLFYALFLASLFLSTTTAIVQRVEGKEWWDTPLVLVQFVLWWSWLFSFAVGIALWLIGVVPTTHL